MLLARAVAYGALFIAFVLVFVPARVLEWSNLPRPEHIEALQILGGALVVAGGILALFCIYAFVSTGKGTPAPFDPPRRLVVRGPYRLVRNPMYIGAGVALCGAALFYRSWALLLYACMFALATHLFVVTYEEPTLASMFGADYAEYRRTVGRWLPRKQKATAG